MRALAAPMPRLAPVIIATFPFNRPLPRRFAEVCCSLSAVFLSDRSRRPAEAVKLNVPLFCWFDWALVQQTEYELFAGA